MASSFSYHRARALRDWCDLGPDRAQLMAALDGAPIDVVDHLYAYGVRVSTLYALEWLPAVDVCWVDGAAGRHALRTQFAADPRATAAGLALLDDWLTRRPTPHLLAAAWYAISTTLATLDADDRAALMARVVARCEAAGRATGGAGQDAISAAERRRIEQVRRALAAPAGRGADLGAVTPSPSALVH